MNSQSFKDLGLSDSLVDVLSGLGLAEPTEVQVETIPVGLAGRNIVASAETGSGKTAAFLLPIIERLKKPGSLRALVLAPTRELALQIESNARSYGRAAGLRSVSVVGGESASRQIKALNCGVDVLIATPGRLNDLIERRLVSLKAIDIFVIDEADRMLDMGFIPQVRRIIRHLPREHQTFLLTATLSKAVEQLACEMMPRYVRIETTRPSMTVATLSQKALPVLSHAKLPLLLALLAEHATRSCLIFTMTRRGADRLSQVLAANRHEVVMLHSQLNQSQRNRALATFRSGRARLLVATDVAARGLDVNDIHFVINYEVPPTAEDYIHRVGRTARAGREGAAFTLVSPEEEARLALIESSTGVKIERSRLAGFSDGRSEDQIRLSSEIGLLRSFSTRTLAPNRASR
jgi:ATP-dependent RNA helicase RhlE